MRACDMHVMTTWLWLRMDGRERRVHTNKLIWNSCLAFIDQSCQNLSVVIKSADCRMIEYVWYKMPLHKMRITRHQCTKRCESQANVHTNVSAHVMIDMSMWWKLTNGIDKRHTYNKHNINCQRVQPPVLMRCNLTAGTRRFSPVGVRVVTCKNVSGGVPTGNDLE